MTYQLNGKNMLFALHRTEIIDISVDDTITVEGFPGASYVWTAQDSEFVENNPDDDVYLQVERLGVNTYKATGIMLK